MSAEDTIVAIATPPGRGGIGVVRLSGDRAVKVATSLLRVRGESPPGLEHRQASLADFLDPASGRTLDTVIVTAYHRPHSYTAEDVVEIACHGAPVILKFLVECCIGLGCRLAEPGEFTMRAFLNGRIDLTQAEAIRDLIESQTLYQARVAAQQTEGSVSARLRPHKQMLIELVARLEAGIDFAEDDVPVSAWQEIAADIERIERDLENLAAGYEFGRIVRNGLRLAIVGRPNVGKSSLFNRLLNQERAIVTAVPGTTRDLVSETAEIGGIPLHFVDTAGIRHTVDEVEIIGVKKSFEAVADSDLRLLVLDASEGVTPDDRGLLERVLPLGPLLVAFNKCDLLRQDNAVSARDRLAAMLSDSPLADRVSAVSVSALTGTGIDELKEEILELAAPVHGADREGELITNLRHQQLLRQSLEALSRAKHSAIEHVPHEMLLIDLYDALHALDSITGATTVDDLLGVIFSTFCVGK
jgi:tRNA modification GTPase